MYPRRAAVESALLPSATVAGAPAQIRAIECLRTGLWGDENGARWNVSQTDLYQLLLDFDARGAVVPFYTGQTQAYTDRSQERSPAGMVLGLIVVNFRLFAVVVTNDAIGLEVDGKKWLAVSTQIEMVVDESRAVSGVRNELASISLCRQATPSLTAWPPLEMASLIERANQSIGELPPVTNAMLSVGMDAAAAGVSLIDAASALDKALTEWRAA